MFQTVLYSSEKEMLLHSCACYVYIHWHIYPHINTSYVSSKKSQAWMYLDTHTFTQNRGFIHLCLLSGLYTG